MLEYMKKPITYQNPFTMHPKIHDEMCPKNYLLKKLYIQITINLAFWFFVNLFVSSFELFFFFIFYCLCDPFDFAFAFPPISNLLIVPLLHFAIDPCVYYMCRNG
jgi:hypothetical protein